MKRAAVQVLAQIRLNLSSVDQFLAIACGLGDDNPDIKEEIYLASNEVRSSALLIDHLRNLFNHQQSIEAQREFFSEFSTKNSRNFGQFQSSSLKQNNVNLKQQQQQDIDINLDRERELNRSEQQLHHHHHDHHHRHDHHYRHQHHQLEQQQRQQQQQQQRCQDNTGLLFTYTNQLTLIRAAKCLVANAAKILYLTDSILAKSGHSLESNSCFSVELEEEERTFRATLEKQKQKQKQQQKYFSTTCGEQNEQQRQMLLNSDQQQQQQQQHNSFAISDRLDNVANYSQLLRSFSELSGELVDLGRCIMLSQQPIRPQTFYQATSFPSYNFLINGPTKANEEDGVVEEEGEEEDEVVVVGGEDREEEKEDKFATGYRQANQPVDFSRELSFCLPPQLPLPLSKQNTLSSSSRHFHETSIASDKFDAQVVSAAAAANVNANVNEACQDDELFQAHLTYPTSTFSSIYRRPISQVPAQFPFSTIEKLQFESDNNNNNFEQQQQLEDPASSQQTNQQRQQQQRQQYEKILVDSAIARQEIISQLVQASDKETMRSSTANIISDGVTEESLAATMSQDHHQQHHKLFSCPPNNLRSHLHKPTETTTTIWNNNTKPSNSMIIIPSIDNDTGLLEVQIQDIQTLFQVNRLIIDRSILLLLSASKCCLWQGNESLRGFSARRSILVQIRASISIIMALVKFSVFSGNDSTKSMSEYRDQMRSNGTMMMKSENIRPSNMLLSECSIQGFQATTLGASSSLKLTDNGLTRLNGSGGNNNISSNNSARQATNCIQANLGSTVNSTMATTITTSRDNQFDYHYLACQSPYWWASKTGALTRTTVSTAAAAASSSAKITTVPISMSNGYNVLPDYELDANIISLSSQQYQQHRQQQQQQQQQQQDFDCAEAANKLFEANKKQSSGISPAAGCHLNGININSKNGSIGRLGVGGSRSNNNENKFNKSNRVDSQLQIMNYFLQTWNGTQSAHDAINKLQTLVAPFRKIGSQRCLIEALDATLVDQKYSNQFSDKPSNATPRYRASSASVEDSTSCWIWNNNSSSNSNSNSNNKMNANNENNKENGYDFQVAAAAGSNSDILTSRDMLLINKRQLINSLNSTFLGETKTNLIERAHEFTDCPYTKHEHRETIVLLLHCIKILLNKFVKLLYKLRRKTTFVSELNLGQLRQLASQLDDTCAELKYELQSVVIEQSDELDRCNVELDLIKQIKHHCLAGDIGKVNRICSQFQEQSEQLVEICKMLNQIAPTHKIKITTKTLAIWFELNLSQLLNIVQCLAQNPRSKVAKDCTWAYIQVWCSFYDDFCQLARQLAYLAHSQFDSDRFERVASLCHQVSLRRRLTEQSSSVVAVGRQERCHDRVTATLSGSGEHQFCGRQVCDETGGGGVGRGVNMVDISPAMANNGEVVHCEQHNRGNQLKTSCSMEQQQAKEGPGVGEEVEVEEEVDRIFLGNSHSQIRTQNRSLSQSRANNTTDVMLDNTATSNVLPKTNRLVHDQEQQHQHQHQHQQIRGTSTLDHHHHQHHHQFINHANSVQSLNMLDTFSDTTGSPRSLDHYYGFGSNYYGRSRATTGPPLESDFHTFHSRPTICLQPSELDYRRQQLHLQQRHHLQQQQQQQQQQQHHQQQQLYLHQQQLPQQDLPYEYSMQRENAVLEQGAFYKNNNNQLAGYQDQWQPVGDSAPIQAPAAPARRVSTIAEAPQLVEQIAERKQLQLQQADPNLEYRSRAKSRDPLAVNKLPVLKVANSNVSSQQNQANTGATGTTLSPAKQPISDLDSEDQDQMTGKDTDQQSSATEPDKWSDSDADAIVRGAKEIGQMALSMYQFTKGEGELNTTQDLFTQAELFAEEANELYKEVRCFSYKVPAGDLKKGLLAELGTIPALVQQMQFIVKNPTVGKPATFAKVDSVIRETRSLMEAVNRVVTATLSCRQHYNMAIASMRKRTRTLSPSYRNDKGFEFESNHSSNRQSSGIGGRHGAGAGSMGSEPDIFQYGRGPSRRAVARSNTASSKTRVSFLLF